VLVVEVVVHFRHHRMLVPVVGRCCNAARHAHTSCGRTTSKSKAS